MTGAELISMFKRIIDDESPDDDVCLDLMNTVKTEIEEERNWRMLLIKDTSLSFLTSETYATVKALPTLFSREFKVKLVDSNNDVETYRPVPYEEILSYKDASLRYAIDMENDQFFICGTVSTDRTIHLHYFKYTADLTTATSPVWPSRFHKILAYKMAEIWLEGVDADTLTRLQWPAHAKAGEKLRDAMTKWDSRLWTKTMDNRAGFEDNRVLNQGDSIDLCQ